MKKCLLILFSFFAAINMNAQYQVAVGTGYFNLDNALPYTGHVYDLTDDLNFDASSYDYAWIKYSGNTGKFSFHLIYSEWKSSEVWGEAFYDSEIMINEAEGISYIELEKNKIYEYGINRSENPYKGDTWDKHIRQAFVEALQEGVSVNIEGLWFGTDEELRKTLNGGQEIDSWTIFGDEKLIGIDWKEKDWNNDMKAIDENNYQFIRNKIILRKGSYDYKVAKNHSLEETYPSNVASLSIPDDGLYNVIFEFNIKTKELKATAELIEKMDLNPNNYINCDVHWDGSNYVTYTAIGISYYKGVELEITNSYHESIKIVGVKIFDTNGVVDELNNYKGKTIEGNSCYKITFGVSNSIQYPSELPWVELTYSCDDKIYTINSNEESNSQEEPNNDDETDVGKGIIYSIKDDGNVEVTGAETWAKRVDIPSTINLNGTNYLVTSIGGRAFEGRSDIDYLSIPYSIKSIGEYAFINCGSNMTVNIEDLASWCLMELGNEHSSPLSSARTVMSNNVVLDRVEIPEGVPYIGNFTFYQCRVITSLIIPSSVKMIGSSAFEDCSGLEKLKLSDGLVTIGGSSFEGCSSLSTLTIPSTVSTIAINAFKNSMGLKEVYCYAENVPDTHEDAFDVTPTGSSTLYVPAGSVEAYKNSWPWSDFKNIVALGSPTDDDSTISGKCGDIVRYTYNKGTKTLTISGEGAMYDYTILDASPWSSYSNEISSVIIESGVTSIGRRAFTSCGLTSVVIPNTVVSIGDNSFQGCSGLTSVTIPNGVYDIYEYAFAGCSLTSLTLPETISKLEEGTFMINSLTSVTIFATNPPKTEGAQVFSNYDIPLYVPAGSEDAYLAKHPWYNFKEILPISESGEESDYKSLLIGKWELIERNGYEHTHVEFKEDGTFSYTSIDRTYYEEHGIFKVEGDILYEWFSDENEWSPSKIVSVDNENLSLQELLDDGITPLGSVDNYRRVSGSSSILNISIDPEIEGVYSIDGVKVNKPRKGINIIKLKDGTTRKIIKKTIGHFDY